MPNCREVGSKSNLDGVQGGDSLLSYIYEDSEEVLHIFGHFKWQGTSL
jgi:hypothetical protein